MKESEISSRPSRKRRLVVAEATSALTLFLSAYYSVRYFEPSLPGLARGITVLAILLSVAAFILAVRIRSPATAGLLILAGVLIQIPPTPGHSHHRDCHLSRPSPRGCLLLSHPGPRACQSGRPREGQQTTNRARGLPRLGPLLGLAPSAAIAEDRPAEKKQI